MAVVLLLVLLLMEMFVPNAASPTLLFTRLQQVATFAVASLIRRSKVAGYALPAAAAMLHGRQSVVIVYLNLKVLLDQREELSNHESVQAY